MKVVAVSGSLAPHSRTAAALAACVARAARVWSIEARLLDLRQYAMEFCDGRPLSQYGPDTQAAVSLVVEADALIFGTPIYRGSYTGALKNLLDLLPAEPMRKKVVGVVASGGSLHHALALAQELGPVLAFFQCLLVPAGVYLSPLDYADGTLQAEGTRRLGQLVDDTVALARATRRVGP